MSHYVSNKELKEKVVAYNLRVSDAKSHGKQIPVMPNDIAKSIFLIADGLSMKPNFRGYPFREDMVSEAVLNCIRYIANVDPKYPSIFAYFTRIAYFTFLRKIKEEKRWLYSKFKAMEHTNLNDLHINDQNVYSDQMFHDDLKNSTSSEDYMNEFIKDFEKTLIKNREKTRR